MSVLAGSPDEEVLSVASRVLLHVTRGFGEWWNGHDEPERERLLATAVERSSSFSPSAANHVRMGTSDVVPICHLIEVVGTQKGLLPEDAQCVRSYRNSLYHSKKTKSGTLAHMEPGALRRFMKAAERMIESFRSPHDQAAVAELNGHLRRILSGPSAPDAPEPPSAPPPMPPRIQEPMYALPKVSRTERTGMDPDGAALQAKLSDDQRAVMQQVLDWFHGQASPAGGLSYFALAGPAGSGKTTVTGLIVRNLKLQPKQVALLAPTGKAVEALKERLPRGWKTRARTLSSFLWRWKFSGYEGEDNQFVKDGEKPVEPDVKLVIVDEASMVTKADFKALLRYARVLYTGDPDQLPPVVEDAQVEPDSVSADVLEKPHAKLAVVHRQQAGSSIRVVAEQARQGRFPDFGPSADSRVLHLSEEYGHLGVEQVRAIVDATDVILTQRNSMRILINEYVRRRRGFMRSPVDHVPKAGEILVCSENYQHPVRKYRVANGERVVITKVLGNVLKRAEEDGVLYFAVIGHPEGREQDVAEWHISSQMLAGDQIRGSVVTTSHVSGPRSGVMRADWGYALTVHKAQGSEWSRVVVVDDFNPDHKIPQDRWHYVAYSRAIDQLIILKVRRDTMLFAPSSAVG